MAATTETCPPPLLWPPGHLSATSSSPDGLEVVRRWLGHPCVSCEMTLPLPLLDASNNEAIPHAAGVYVAWDYRHGGVMPVYVGESKCLRRRLAERPELAGTKLGLVECLPAKRKLYESLLIGWLNPRLNAASTWHMDPHHAAERFESILWEECVASAMKHNGTAMLNEVALRSYVRIPVVRSAWRRFQRKELLVIQDKRAFVRTYDYDPDVQDDGFFCQRENWCHV
jgi:hypothetical protein